MTADVAFHTGIPDKLGYACRLLRKAWRQGVPVVVTGESPLLQRLDVLLWTFEQEEFVPHVRVRAGEPTDPLLARTPIWLADVAVQAPAAAAAQAVLVNLGAEVCADYARFARVVELVSDDAQDVRQGRERWRRYQGDGVTPRLHAQPRGAPGGTEA